MFFLVLIKYLAWIHTRILFIFQQVEGLINDHQQKLM